MVDIVNFILLTVALIIIARFTVWCIKRIIMIRKLKALAGEHSGELKFIRFPLLPNLLASEQPDISLRIDNTVYLIRLYSGGNQHSIVHFASEKYSVRYTKMASRMASTGKWRAAVVEPSQAFTVGAKVFVTPPMQTETDEEAYGVQIEKILLFNPAPNTVSYVTPEKTNIKLAFTGDEMHGMKIFTASSFVAYADRATRKNDEMIYF